MSRARHQLGDFYKRRSKFGVMDAALMSRLKELEEENRRLKKMYAEAQLSADIVKEALAKKWWGHLIAGRWPHGRSGIRDRRPPALSSGLV